MDDSIEANVSTFAAEMRETAFILRNIDRRSMYECTHHRDLYNLTACRAVIDELGRGTSTRDGILFSDVMLTITYRLWSGFPHTSTILLPSWPSAMASYVFV